VKRGETAPGTTLYEIEIFFGFYNDPFGWYRKGILLSDAINRTFVRDVISRVDRLLKVERTAFNRIMPEASEAFANIFSMARAVWDDDTRTRFF
jgi:hypothetical protein